MPTIKFFTRTVTTDKNALVPIWVRLRSGRAIDIECKSDILVKPDNWSKETQMARQRADVFNHKTGNIEDSGRKTFNEKITSLRTSIETAIQDTPASDINPQWLKTVIDKHWHPERYKINLFSYIESFNKTSGTRLNPKSGRPVCYKMQREYEVTFGYLKEYAEKIKKQIAFKDIDLKFYEGFTQFLQDKKMAVNTIGKKVQTLKIFLNAAREEGLNPYDNYKSSKFKTVSEDAETIALDEKELSKLYELDLSAQPARERVRDLFLVGCWTGCRFSDISQIVPENITGGFIRIKQHKTGKEVVIPLHPVVTVILNKYGGKLPPAISNQKFNVVLKAIAKDAEIKDTVHKAITKGGVKTSKAYKKYQLVTTHCGRRSFATNLYLANFPTLSIMAITGHKTEKAFLRYIKVTPDEHAKKLQQHWEGRHLKVV
jgi:integrase